MFGKGNDPRNAVEAAPDFFAPYSQLYRKAADQLLEPLARALVSPRHEVEVAFRRVFMADLIPVLFLYRHSFELQLKEILDQLDQLDDKKTSERMEHSIYRLWKEARPRVEAVLDVGEVQEGFVTFSERLRYLDNELKRLHDADPKGTAFRYADSDRSAVKFDLERFSRAIEQTATALDQIRDGLFCAQDIKDGVTDDGEC